MTAPDASTLLDTQERARCAVVARRMAAQQSLGLLALACSGTMLLGLAAGAWRDAWQALAIAAVLFGVVERYFALRLQLDAGLFADLAAGRIPDLASLDTGLAALGVAPRATRPLDDRITGCRRLWRRHLVVVALQAGITLLAVVSS